MEITGAPSGHARSFASEFWTFVAENTCRIEDKFDYIQALTEEGTKVKSLKRLLETCKPGWAVMVGDRIYDLEAAEENELPFIACKYGYCAPGELDGCEYTATSISDIPLIVEQMVMK